MTPYWEGRMWKSAGRVVGRSLLAVCIAGPSLFPTPTPVSASSPVAYSRAQDTTETLEELAAKATAAVVFIEVKSGGKSRQGSGFIIDETGLLLTNYHVIRDATSASVRLSSGDVYDHVTILATDERRDMAALRIPGFALPSLELGNSDSVRIGSPAIAIGSPLGLENTVSTGIVSGRRSEPEGFQLLQLTAPASSGSSGGPVLSRDGLVIGIATSQMRSGQNLNFAVPINYARGMLSKIDGDPVAVLTATPGARVLGVRDMAAVEARVNRGIDFDLSEFRDHRIDIEERGIGGGITRSRITYRRIQDVTGGSPRIERYLESQTTVERGSLGPSIVTRTERRRTITSATDLRPISALGELAWQIDGQWRRLEYDLRFDGDHVRGTIQDSSGVVAQIDRELPGGILFRETRDLAFGAMATEGIVGQSLELVTFDAASGQIAHDRYDVRRESKIEVQGREHEVWVVDLASGLTNERAYFMTSAPRIPLRRERGQDGGIEEVTALFWYPEGEDPDDR